MVKKPESASSAAPGFDFASMMSGFDPSQAAAEFAKIAQRYRLPGVDMNVLVESQRRNIDALNQANRAAIEGIQAVAKRQAEIIKEAMEQANRTVERLSKSESPQMAATKQVEVLKEAYEKAISDAREISELLVRSNREAADAIHQRVRESLDELKALASKLEPRS